MAIKWILQALFIILISSSSYAVDLTNISFIDYVRYVANTSQVNIVIDEEVDTKFSVILPDDLSSKDSFSIFRSVLNKNKLYLVKYGSVYYVKKLDDNKRFYSIKLKYLLPDVVIPIIKEYYPSLVVSKSKRTLIYLAAQNVDNDVRTLVELLDRETKSKKIKIQMISFNDKDLSEYGLNLAASHSDKSGSISYQTLISDLTVSQKLLLSFTNMQLDFFLSDLKTKSLIDFKFAPIISLFDNKPTSFDMTTNIGYLSQSQSVNGSNDVQQNSYAYKDVGSVIKIDQVSVTDDKVYFHIDMKYETILDKSATPTTSKKAIDNYIDLKNGQTLMIAGLKDSEDRVQHREIPLLSSIPLLGSLFKWDSKTKQQNTFAIFISNIDTNTTYDLNATSEQKGAPLAGK